MGEILPLLERLRLTGDRFPIATRPSFSPGASEEAIAAMKCCIPLPLPADFLEFLRACDAIQAMDIWNGYWIGDASGLTRSISRGDLPSSIKTDNEERTVFPVATDGGGNAFLALRDDTVWKWNHETGDTRKVADDFAGFLERVLDDWEHFLSGDDTWDYLAG